MVTRNSDDYWNQRNIHAYFYNNLIDSHPKKLLASTTASDRSPTQLWTGL